MISCVVYGCPNSADPDPSVHYYVFPKHPVIAQQWISAAGWQSGQIDLETARICSIHFDENCYTNEYKLIDYMPCYSKILKYDAIPTLYLPAGILINDVDEGIIIYSLTSDQRAAAAVEAKKEYIGLQAAGAADIKKEYIELQEVNAQNPQSNENFSEKRTKVVNPEKYLKIKTVEQLQELKKENEKLQKEIQDLERSIINKKKILNEKIDLYKLKDLDLTRLKTAYLKKKFSLSLDEQKLLLSKVFSESQIKILFGRKKIYWSNDDMAVGFTIRHLSNKRCYMYLAKNLNIPLPAVSSIKRWMTTKNSAKKGSIEEKEEEDDIDSEVD